MERERSTNRSFNNRNSNYNTKRDAGRSNSSYSGFNPQTIDIPQRVEIYSNFFELIKKPNWHLYQYHVDFEPATENKRLKSMLVKTIDSLKNSVFDGTTLFTTSNLIKTVFSCTKPGDGVEYKLTVRKTVDIYPSGAGFMIDIHEGFSKMAIEDTENIKAAEDTEQKDQTSKDFIRVLNLIFKL